MPAPAPPDPGSYVLLAELASPQRIEFGAAGVFDLEAGWFAYVGTAFGPGGLQRVDRHRELAAGDRDVRHWHIDYLLGHPAVALRGAHVAIERDIECDLAEALADVADTLPLGASDCGCSGHLFSATSRERLRDAVTPLVDDR